MKQEKCPECYVANNRATPLLNPRQCLENHIQYICGTCGRCICMNETAKHLRRWNFPFKTSDIALLYLRSADASTQTNCGIYELDGDSRKSYKIFTVDEEFKNYLSKKYKTGKFIFRNAAYKVFPNTQIRRLSQVEAERYLNEQKSRQ